jgi:hypothetical protein
MRKVYTNRPQIYCFVKRNIHFPREENVYFPTQEEVFKLRYGLHIHYQLYKCHWMGEPAESIALSKNEAERHKRRRKKLVKTIVFLTKIYKPLCLRPFLYKCISLLTFFLWLVKYETVYGSWITWTLWLWWYSNNKSAWIFGVVRVKFLRYSFVRTLHRIIFDYQYQFRYQFAIANKMFLLLVCFPSNNTRSRSVVACAWIVRNCS